MGIFPVPLIEIDFGWWENAVLLQTGTTQSQWGLRFITI
jgi:hypothetical protein